jgi:hypothetical protein
LGSLLALALVLTLDQTRSYLAACAAGAVAQWWAETMLG